MIGVTGTSTGDNAPTEDISNMWTGQTLLHAVIQLGWDLIIEERPTDREYRLDCRQSHLKS